MSWEEGKYEIAKFFVDNVVNPPNGELYQLWKEKSYRAHIPFLEINSFSSLFSEGPLSLSPFSSSSAAILEAASSSATKDVVTLTRGKIAILDTWLNTAIDTPTAASSTGPAMRQHDESNSYSLVIS